MLKIDLHTHTIASGHAINTVFELAYFASQNGITHLGISDHGPSMKGASHAEYFWISEQVDELYGVRVYLGIEANILNNEGDIDLPIDLLKKQKIVYAGLHNLTPFESQGKEYNTTSIIKAIQNPFVKFISHPYRPEFPVNLDEIFYASVKHNTILELNNNLFSHSESLAELIPVYRSLVALCKKDNRKLIIGSDAHLATKVGNDNFINLIFKELGLTPEIILNNYPSEVEAFLNS